MRARDISRFLMKHMGFELKNERSVGIFRRSYSARLEKSYDRDPTGFNVDMLYDVDNIEEILEHDYYRRSASFGRYEISPRVFIFDFILNPKEYAGKTNAEKSLEGGGLEILRADESPATCVTALYKPRSGKGSIEMLVSKGTDLDRPYVIVSVHSPAGNL